MTAPTATTAPTAQRPQLPSAAAPAGLRVTVVGAGVVGACVAWNLQNAGCQVTLVDPLPAGSETSFGNAGLISVDSCIPISLPGMAWQAPGWLLDPTGPLSIRLGYLPHALPWLLKWLRAGRRSRVLAAAVALHALHRPALAEYEGLLGSAFAALIERKGQLHLWGRSGAATAADRLVAEIRQRQQIAVEPLDQARIRAMLPGLSDTVQRGIAFTGHAHCLHPQRLVQTVVARFAALGGDVRQARVQRVQTVAPVGTQRFRVWTSTGSHVASHVVLATGAFTNKLLAPLGVKLPLEAERGYHVELPAPGVSVPLPFIDKDRAVAVTPMAEGLRIAGTVEFAGLDHPPDPRRAEALLRLAQELYPGINVAGARTWQGSRPSTPDSLPMIDELPGHPGLFVACGHGHTGMTGAPMTGRLVADLLTRRRPALDPRPYRLARFA